MEINQEWYLNKSEADDYQYQVMEESIDTPLIVTGCAGSGKSILALWKLKQILDYRRGSCLYIVFTKALKAYMKAGIRMVGLKENSVLYYHEWKSQKCPAADYIIVDEAQDFSREEIFQFMQKARKTVFFYGDSAQQLYEFDPYRRPVDMEEIKQMTGYKIRELMYNHRLPVPIAKVADCVSKLGGKKNDPIFVQRCLKNDGEKPRIIKCNGIMDQLATILPFIERIHGRGGRIGILCRHNQHVKKAYEYFRDNSDVDFDVKYDKGRDNNMFDLDFETSMDNPKLMTFHSAKGIQFTYVIILDYKDDGTNVIPFYVAMTRSSKELIITYSGNCPSYFTYVSSDLYQTSLNGSSKSNKPKLSF